MGCSLATSLVAGINEFRKRISPDFLFIEPSERVITLEMRHMLTISRREMAYDLGPFITLVDGTAFEMLWEERRPLLIAQMTGADLVAVSKADLLTPGQMTNIVTNLQAHNPNVRPLSTNNHLGLKEVLSAIIEA